MTQAPRLLVATLGLSLAMAGAAVAQEPVRDRTAELNAAPPPARATPPVAAPEAQPAPQPIQAPAPPPAPPRVVQTQPPPASTPRRSPPQTPAAPVQAPEITARPAPSPAPAAQPPAAVGPTPAPAPAPAAAPRPLTPAEIEALPFTLSLAAPYVLTAGRPGPDFQVWTVRKDGIAQLMIYAGPAAQFPIHDGETVVAGGRTSVVVVEEGRRRALEHLFQQSQAPRQIHIWVASLDGADRDRAEALAHTVTPR